MERELFESIVNTFSNGGIVLLPGDTIFGISCDATNEVAVQKIINIKGRDETKSFIVLVADDNMLQRYVQEVPEVAWELIDSAEDPLTIVFDQGKGVAKSVLAKNGSLAIRIVKDGDMQRLIRKLRRPIVSTSANVSGTKSPIFFEDIAPIILDQVDQIVPSPATKKGLKASSIIRIGNNGEIEIIRK